MGAERMTTLAEFLWARVAEDQRRDEERLISSFLDTGATAEQIETKLRGTTRWALISVNHAARRVGVAAAASFPAINGPWLRKMAAQYSDHPDFDPAWSVT
jgi:hypothetical protein